MEKTNFNNLMDRYLKGETTVQERIKIEAWLDVMKTGSNTSLELSREEEEQLFQKIVSKSSSIKDVASFRSGKTAPGNRTILRIAAALLILLVASWLVWTFAENNFDAQATSESGIEKIILNDGTLVWLRAGSRLSYVENLATNTRNTNFQGEALFEVAKDPGRPFVINCGNATLKVLGTSFKVKLMNDSLQLIVLTGKVNLSSTAGNVNVDVMPNQKVVYKNGEVVKSSVPESEVPLIVANTEYNMRFSDVPLSVIAERLSAKFNARVTVADPRAAKCRITADFTDHSLENTLQLISEVLEIEYTRNENSIIITGPGCH